MQGSSGQFGTRLSTAKSEMTLTRGPTDRLSWTFFLCSSDQWRFCWYPTKLMYRPFYLLVHLNGLHGPYSQIQILPALDSFLGIAGFVTT